MRRAKKSFFHREAWMYFYRFLKPHKTRIIATSIGFVISAYLIVPTVLLVKYVFDVAIPQKDINIFIWVGLAILGLRLLNSGLTLWLRRVNIRLTAETIYRFREQLMNRIFSLSRSFYTREDLSIMHTRVVQDTERVSRMSNAIVSGLIPSLLISIGLFFVLLYLSWYLFLVILAFFPLMYFSSLYMGKIVKQRVNEFHRAFEGFSKGTLFLMRFMDLIKTQSAEEQENVKQKGLIDILKEKTTNRAYFRAMNRQVQNVLVGLIGILVLIFGGISVISGSMTLGDLMAFYLAASQLQTKLNNLGDAFTTLVSGNESLVTLYDFIYQNDSEPYSGVNKIGFKGNVRFSSVWFSYTDKPVLKGIAFEIKPGSRKAIIGANGTGKSTIIHLLLGFYRPDSGSISAEGIEYTNIDFKHYRKQIGVVSQHPPLIPGSLRENIVFGHRYIDEERIIEACRLSLADSFINLLPDGYDTGIGNDGILLSGGERQKVAIARALLNKPRLLILDEPTNHLDYQSVREIMLNISRLAYKPAVLIISHDMEVINHADDIFVIKNGMLFPFKKKEAQVD